VTSKHQVTIPAAAFEAAGLEEGDTLSVRVAGPGRIILERPHAVIDEFRGAFHGVYEADYLDALRDEWE
jgi:AbrB family looped-hinge helix DNA binding protein